MENKFKDKNEILIINSYWKTTFLSHYYKELLDANGMLLSHTCWTIKSPECQISSKGEGEFWLGPDSNPTPRD